MDIEIVVGREQERLHPAAAIWSAATAERDLAEVVPTAEASVPLLRAALDSSPGSLLMSAVRDGESLGFAVVSQASSDRIEVLYLAVAPSAWGSGVATLLLGAAAAVARRRACEFAELWVYSDNTRAVSAYERNGWERDGATRVHARSGRIEQRHRRPARSPAPCCCVSE